MLTLRWYQREAIDAVYNYFSSGKKGNPILKIPTGGGKSLIQAEFIKEICHNWPTQRILCLAHVKELLQQNYDELIGQYPGADAGIYSAGIGKKQLRNQITFAGIQSIWDKSDRVGHVDLCFVDECHLIPSKSMGRYRQFLDNLKLINPKIKIIGLSATPWRLDGGDLCAGKDSIFSRTVYEVSITTLINEGALCDIYTADSSVTIDMSKLKTSQATHDYTDKSLRDVFESMESTRPALEEAIQLAKDRRSWIVFATSVEHAHNISQILDENSISNKIITGETNKGDRAEFIEEFKRYEFRALISVSCLTTGFNAKNADCMICLRATQSSALWVQMVGRVLRSHPNKKEGALLLDYGKNIETHGPIEDIKPPVRKEGTSKKSPFRTCPECDTNEIPIGVKVCPECGFEFVVNRSINIDERAAKGLEIISAKRQEPVWTDVQSISVSRHKSRLGKADTLKIDYYCGVSVFSEWLPDFKIHRYILDSGDVASSSSIKEKINNGGITDLIGLIVAGDIVLVPPAKIMLQKNGKYNNVTGRIFDHSIIRHTIEDIDVNTNWQDMDDKYHDDVPF